MPMVSSEAMGFSKIYIKMEAIYGRNQAGEPRHRKDA